MKPATSMAAISALRWTTGLVALSEALHLATSSTSAPHFAHFGLPLWIGLALAWGEAAAALLFLAPITTMVGGYFLLSIFILAIAVHLHGHDFRVGPLLVYLIAVVVSIAHARKTVGGGEGD